MQQVLPNLYISSWYTIIASGVLEKEGITHVLSVMRNIATSEVLNPFERMIIDVDDDPDEAILDHFESTNRWIDDALAEGGKVVVHCLAGRSRSATVLAAYIMNRFTIGVSEAISKIQKVREVDPNQGFREQLQVYLDCNFVANSSKAAYRHWKLRQDTRLQKEATGKWKKPEVVTYTSPATGPENSGDSPTVDLRCKKCRRILASSSSFVIHQPPKESAFLKLSYSKVASTPRAQVDSVLPSQCGHFFLEPQDWMQPTIEQGELEGKLECPKCSSKVGSFAWQGIRCSCGTWVTPGFSLGRSKVDEVRRLNASSNTTRRPTSIEPVKSKA